MSIGVERVNGGVIGGQWTEGYLEFFKVTGPAEAFIGSYGETGTEKGPRPAPKSAAEEVYKFLAQYGTPVIFEIVSATEIHLALAYGVRRDEDFDDFLTDGGTTDEEGIQGLGVVNVNRFFGGADVTATSDDLEGVTVDFSAATVEKVAFELA